jgi:hypothetical protein
LIIIPVSYTKAPVFLDAHQEQQVLQMNFPSGKYDYFGKPIRVRMKLKTPQKVLDARVESMSAPYVVDEQLQERV